MVLILLFPKEEINSDCAHYLMREVITKTVLENAVDTFSDPDFLIDCLIDVCFLSFNDFLKKIFIYFIFFLS